MRLYYMTTLETAVKYILPERRMRLSRFERLNDPFELMFASTADKDDRPIFKKLRDHWSNSLGIICMGKHWSSPVMWGHYAGNHTGVCLGFEVPDGLAKQMVYEPARLQGLLDPTKPLRGLDTAILERVITTKYSQWAYEEEWRVWSKLEDPDSVNGEYYINFGDIMSLREIIVGVRCKNSVGSFKKLVGEVDHPVTIMKARTAFDSFTMVRQQRVKPIVVKPRRR